MKKDRTDTTPKRPPGRPKSTNPKLDGLRIRLTLDELHAVNAAAGDITVSEWARRALLKAARRARTAQAKVIPAPPEPAAQDATPPAPKPAGTI